VWDALGAALVVIGFSHTLKRVSASVSAHGRVKIMENFSGPRNFDSFEVSSKIRLYL